MFIKIRKHNNRLNAARWAQEQWRNGATFENEKAAIKAYRNRNK